MKMRDQFIIKAVIYVSLILGSTILYADRILVIGDSWAQPTAAGLYKVLVDRGRTGIYVQNTPYLGYASEMSSTAGLNTITAWLTNWPDTTIVHLSLGANDMGLVWTPAMAGTSQEADLFSGIMQDIDTIADHIFMLRPDMQILWSSYDFFRPLPSVTPAENNSAYLGLAERSAQLAESRPDDLTYLNLYGLFQVTYGFDGIRHTEFDPSSPIPAGDPSLPNPSLPSPYQPYQGDVSHPTVAGYKVVAGAQYDRYYESRLGDQGFQINAGLNDAWYNPDTDGQGFFITVFPDLALVSLAWFTYDTELPAEDAEANFGDAGHRWLTAIGPVEGNQVLMNIDIASGGIFDTSTEIEHTDPPGSDGTIILTFDSCNSGTVEYDITSIDRQGIVPIRRVVDDNIVLCEALKAAIH